MVEPESGMLASFGGVENIVDVIKWHAATGPQRPALIDGDRTISYSELQQVISRYAGYLQELGLRPTAIRM